ncbi:MAG: 30S ribosomal protein S5 [bacterium]|nr:30S ribosomal protein S5 [bacterium]
MRKREFHRGRRVEQSEFDQKIIDIRRVARVMAGGRRFNFRVTVVIGNHKGEVGVGLGKAADTSSAIEKAVRIAKNKRISVPFNKNKSISHQVSAKLSSARIIIKPSREGRGLVAGSSLRTVLYLAGVNDVTAKILSRSKNKVNIARAAILALSGLSDRDGSKISVKEVKEDKEVKKENAIA